ncbi:MAG: nucleoside deaminase [Actinophytocola sp.]|uniref:nucleoside deaminase n=1 Tax=Actinophytocola sp. TaxID=1872138 RepID=UPI0013261F2A|nr:nucleoside deaminase [Actinophytocola sp.]MPZ79360.1 nucleoside deaminase [Actinophytocola sp.]
MTSEPAAEWRAVDLGVRRSLELAHQTLLAGGLPVGAVLLDGAGEIVAEGRNRCYDPPGGDDPLQGTPLGHAELVALAGVSTARDLSAMALWTSHRPCPMCAAACAFTGVGTVRFVAPDPSDPEGGADPDDVDHRWLVVANLLFLTGIRAYVGPSAPMIARARFREPETVDLLDTTEPGTLRAGTLTEALAPIRHRIDAAADRRRDRVG